jgi:hypothetical protein
MNRLTIVNIMLIALAVFLVSTVKVRAQNEVGGAAAVAASPASPQDQILSLDRPIQEFSGSSERQSDDPIEKRANIGLIIGPKLGAGFSQVFSDLGTSLVGELEIGYLLPLQRPIGRSIELFIAAQYAQPTMDGKTTKEDPRLPEPGMISYEVTQQQLILTLGALCRIPLGGKVGAVFTPYAALGARLYMTRTQVDGSTGEKTLGENNETGTDVGFYHALGGDFFVGPGSAFLEAQLTYTGFDGYIMRKTNVGALNLAAGYRLFI